MARLSNTAGYLVTGTVGAVPRLYATVTTTPGLPGMDA